MINGINIVIILGIIILETSSQILARKFYDSGKDNDKIWYMFLSFLLYAPILYLLTLTYEYSEFAISNALWDSGTIIATTIIGYSVFKENLSWRELIGLALVITGAVMLGLYSRDVSLDPDI